MFPKVASGSPETSGLERLVMNTLGPSTTEEDAKVFGIRQLGLFRQQTKTRGEEVRQDVNVSLAIGTKHPGIHVVRRATGEREAYLRGRDDAVTARLIDRIGFRDEAYSRMAELRVGSQGYEGIYRFLVNYYATKKDEANFEKYKAIGKELYPKSEFFTYDKVDFAVGLEEDFNKKIEALEATVASDPNNTKAVQLVAELIYDTLNSQKDGAVQPANAAALEGKMLAALNKLTQLKPDDEYPYLLLGGHFINKRDKLDEVRSKHVTEMKSRTKPGAPASKEDVAKRDTLDAQFARALLAIEAPYVKAAEIYSKKPQPMTAVDIQRYKNVAGYLGDIATFKKNKAKGNAADLAKYTAEEKKWNDLYDEISKMKPKPRD